jgi:hypothetical protein
MIILQTVGLPGRVISSSQGLYLNTGQHKYRINIYTYQTPMPYVGFGPTILASERAKAVHALCRVLRGSVELPLGERELLPHADKHRFVYVLELCKSEAKRPLLLAWPRKQRPFMFDCCFYSHLVFHNGNIHRKSDISFQKTRALRPQKQSLS